MTCGAPCNGHEGDVRSAGVGGVADGIKLSSAGVEGGVFFADGFDALGEVAPDPEGIDVVVMGGGEVAGNGVGFVDDGAESPGDVDEGAGGATAGIDGGGADEFAYELDLNPGAGAEVGEALGGVGAGLEVVGLAEGGEGCAA